MSRRAPFLIWIGRPLHRGQRPRVNFGNHVLHHFHLVRSRKTLVRVLVEMRQRILTGAEAVHQQQAHLGITLFAKRERLPHHQIEKVHAVAHRQQALRSLQTHPRPQPAVQLDHHRLSQQMLAATAIQLIGLCQIPRGLDRLLTDHPRLLPEQRLVVPLENRHRRVTHASGPHLDLKCVELTHSRILHHHTTRVNPKTI